MKINFRLVSSSFILVFCLCLPNVHAGRDLPPIDSKKTISMDFQNALLNDVLKVFSLQAGLNFIASEAVQERKITLFLDKVSTEEAMDKIFKANNLTYELDKDSSIFIVKDWGKPQLETITKVYYLKYRSVPSAKLEKEKNNLLSATKNTQGASASSGSYGASSQAKGAGAGSGTNGDSTSNIVASLKQVLSPEGKIAEDISTNSLIVTDVPNRFSEVERIIACLDVPQQQIMLDVEILDVNRNIVDKMGFRWGEDTTDGGSPFTLLIPGGAGKDPKFFLGNIAKTVKQWPTAISSAGAVVPSPAAGSVVLGSTYSQILDFLHSQTDTRYLARPRLLTLNNETAEISITKDEVVGFNEDTTVTSGVVVTKRTYIRSTDLALTKEGTGVFLRVTPQINPDTQEITMVLNPKSSITNESRISTTQSDAEIRSAKSIVKVKDGETVILGGLINRDKKTISNKLPILGDIPLFNVLFKHKDQQKDIDRELLIFITPRIVKETNINLVQANRIGISSKEQNIGRGDSRQTAVSDWLNKLDKKGK